MFRSTRAVGPLLSGSEHVAPFACYRCPYGYPERNGAPQLDLCKMTCANFVRYVLEKEGVPIPRPPGPMKHGGSVIAFIEDPDGYKIELIERKPN